MVSDCLALRMLSRESLKLMTTPTKSDSTYVFANHLKIRTGAALRKPLSPIRATHGLSTIIYSMPWLRTAKTIRSSKTTLYVLGSASADVREMPDQHSVTKTDCLKNGSSWTWAPLTNPLPPGGLASPQSFRAVGWERHSVHESQRTRWKSELHNVLCWSNDTEENVPCYNLHSE